MREYNELDYHFQTLSADPPSPLPQCASPSPSVAVLPNGRFITGSFNKVLQAWDAEIGECISSTVVSVTHPFCLIKVLFA